MSKSIAAEDQRTTGELEQKQKGSRRREAAAEQD